jgi:hypothetical protein
MRHNPFPFLYRVDAIGRQIVEGFGLPRRPDHIYTVNMIVRTEAKVQA